MYRGRGRRRRRRKRRRGWGSYYHKAMAPVAAYGAYRIAESAIKKYVNVEYKSFDSNAILTATDTGAIQCLTLIPQGDAGEDERDGDQIRITGLLLTIRVSVHASANVSACRIIVFRDNDQNGTNTPGVGGNADSVLETATYRGFRELHNTSRFHILMDKYYNVGEHAPLGESYTFKKFFKTHHKCRFTGTTGVAASMGNGSLWIIVISNEGTYPPQVDTYWRVRYLDN